MKEQSSPASAAELQEVVSSCACFNLRKASRVVTQSFDEALKPSGLLITQFTILVAVNLSKAVTVNVLAERLVMDRTTLTRNLKPMIREGWLQSEPGRDRRTRVISLTPDGTAVLAEAMPLWKRAQNNVVDVLGQEHWQVLLAHLTEATALMRQD